jgi:hypothetical protein
LNLDGSLKWSYQYSNATSDLLPTAPSIDDNGNLYFGSLTAAYAVTSTGSLLWSYIFDASLTSVVVSYMAIGTNAIFASFNNKIYSLSKSSGTENWNRIITQRADFHISGDDTVYASDGTLLYTLSPTTGNTLTNIPFNRPNSSIKFILITKTGKLCVGVSETNSILLTFYLY